MKKALLGTFVGIVLLGILVVAVFAEPYTLNWGQEANAGECEQLGSPVVNITHKVVNDVDSAVGGGVWATDNYSRHVQIWQIDEDSFCVVATYVGKFITDDGNSPQGGSSIDAGLEGNMQGGYRGIFNGTLVSDPAQPAKGNLGTFDYDCDVETDPGDHSTCTDLFSWPSTYFTGFSGFTYEWWGWIYHTATHGTWVNKIDGNEGDIY